MGGNGQTLWTNYIAHGLRALTIGKAHEKIDGVYHQTELGRILAKRMLGDWEPPSDEESKRFGGDTLRRVISL